MINRNSLILYNAEYYADNEVRKGTIIIEDGIIKKLADHRDEGELHSGSDIIDCSKLYVYPGFIDSHLHLPGDYLFRSYGVYLAEDYTVAGYIGSIKKVKKNDYSIIRGFGWNNVIMENEHGLDAFRTIKQLIDSIYCDRLVILYADDYHSCICNQFLLQRYKPVREYEYPINETGLLKEEDVFALLRRFPELIFSDEEIKASILDYQNMLLSNGITSAQTLMFLGGDDNREWKILKELDDNKELRINVNMALTVHPYHTKDHILRKFIILKGYTSDKIRLETIKIYIDGVVENKTAFLSEPYADSTITGTSLWNEKELYDICRFIDKNNLQLHVHAIGDAAVHLITEALCSAMDINNSKGKNRHVITHLQVTDDRDIRRMGEYGIVACIQPYWIPMDDILYPIDVKNLGIGRARGEYKVDSFIKNNVVVTASSDSPVTRLPYPVTGISYSVFRNNQNEKTSASDILNAFTKNGAYQLYRENETGIIKEGYKADLTILSGNLLTADRKELENIKVVMTIKDGIVVYHQGQ